MELRPETPDERISRFLGGHPYQLSSPLTFDYNCIAWAAGKDDEWWEDGETGMPHQYWPPNIGRSGHISELVQVFEFAEFIECGMDGAYEPAYDKVALFARGNEWTHACRVCQDGRLWSKMGAFEDVLHDLEGIKHTYGSLVTYMIRERRESSQLYGPSATVAV